MSSTFKRSNTRTNRDKNTRKSLKKTIRRSLSVRQVGMLLKSLNNDVKNYIEKENYADYKKKIEKWKVNHAQKVNCSVMKYMNDEENARIFTSEVAKNYNIVGKNVSVYKGIIPEKGCKRVVFGLNKDLNEYLKYNNSKDPEKGDFIVLAVDNWDESININFITCAIQNEFNTCNSEIAILIPRDTRELIKTEEGEYVPRITAYENEVFYKALELLKKRGNVILDDPNFTYKVLLYNTKKLDPIEVDREELETEELEREEYYPERFVHNSPPPSSTSAGGKSRKRKRKHKRKARTIKKRYR